MDFKANSQYGINVQTAFIQGVLQKYCINFLGVTAIYIHFQRFKNVDNELTGSFISPIYSWSYVSKTKLNWMPTTPGTVDGHF